MINLFLGCLILIFPIAEGYAFDIRPIDPDVLIKSIKDWVIIDARPKAQWEKGHLPEALSISWDEYTKTDEKQIKYRIMPPEQLAAEIGRKGIDAQTPVAIYGDADTSWGAEGWVCWALIRIGHEGPIRVLNGGIENWEAHKLPLTKKPPQELPKTAYHTNVRHQVTATTEEIIKNGSKMYLVDTRSTIEWYLGHIKGAIHIKWNEFYTGSVKTALTPLAAKKLLQANGVGNDKPVVYYCTGGVRSAYAWMVHQMAGMTNAENYEGGMAAWKQFGLNNE